MAKAVCGSRQTKNANAIFLKNTNGKIENNKFPNNA
jgi:hypothetical protein